MRRLMLAVALLVPAAAFAQGPLDGTWKIDLSSVKFPEKPDQYVLSDGRYRCPTCVPAVDVKADGTDQKITGSKYRDSVAVTVVNDRTVRFTSKKDGKVVSEGTSTLSADGKTLTEEFTSYPPDGEPVKGKMTAERVAAGPAGAHALSGSWKATKATDFSDAGLTFTLKSTPGGLAMTSPTGESYDAKFDGKDYPIKGDRGGSTVAIRKIDDRTVEETIKRDGKVVGVSRMSASEDGRTMNFEYDNKERGATMRYAATKQ